jgi:hypothetical protein
VRMPADTPGKMPKEQLDNWLKLYGEESIASTSLADKKNTIQ